MNDQVDGCTDRARVKRLAVQRAQDDLARHQRELAALRRGRLVFGVLSLATGGAALAAAGWLSVGLAAAATGLGLAATANHFEAAKLVDSVAQLRIARQWAEGLTVSQIGALDAQLSAPHIPNVDVVAGWGERIATESDRRHRGR